MSSTARKWAPWALLIMVAVALLAVGVQRGGGRPSLDAQVQHISSEVRCPVCNGETVAQSQAAPSVQIRNEIRSDLQKGESEGQILSSLVSSYGQGILEKPQAKGLSLLVWVLPVVGVVIAAAGLLVLLRRWKTEPSAAAATVVEAPGPGDGQSSSSDEDVAGREVGAVPAAVGAATGTVVASPAGPATAGPAPAGPAPAGPAPAGPAPGVPPSIGSSDVPADDRARAERPAPGDPDPASPTAVPARRSRRTKTILACAGVVLVAGGASWAVASSSGTRLPGQTITGQALGAPAEAAALQAAQTDENRNDIFGAIKEYQKVLNSDPKQVEALSGEGWLLAETGQPALLKQGLSLLVQAEQAQPDYPAAHLYRGLALLGEADYADCVPELQWYLAHNPDPQIVAQVKKALADAQSKAASQVPATSTPSG